MISSQRRDGVFTFNMYPNQLLPIIADNSWKKDCFKDVNIYVPESAKNMISNETQDLPQIFTKFSNQRIKQWNDISLTQMLGKFSDLKDFDKKDK